MNNRLTIIAGPCVIESVECVREVASELKEICDELNVELYFKASFDKANRTSVDSYRGPGIEEGLKILQSIKKEFNLRIVICVVILVL